MFLLTVLLSMECFATAATGQITNPSFYAFSNAAVTTAAWTQLTASTTKAASAIIASNATGSFLILGRGAAASEVSTGLIIPPRETGVLIPIAIKKGERLSLKAISSDTTGAVGVTFFQ